MKLQMLVSQRDDHNQYYRLGQFNVYSNGEEGASMGHEASLNTSKLAIWQPYWIGSWVLSLIHISEPTRRS